MPGPAAMGGRAGDQPPVRAGVEHRHHVTTGREPGARLGACGCSSRVPVVHFGSVSTDELLAEVLRLPRQDRVRVAEELFVSLEEPDEDVAAAWAGELERRSRDLAAGRVRTVPWETVRARIMNELEQRREGRASS